MKTLLHPASTILAILALTQAAPAFVGASSPRSISEELPARPEMPRATYDAPGFEENKGQVTTMAGAPASFVKFRYAEGNTNIFLLDNGIAYQFDRVHLPEGYDQLLQEARQDPAKQEQLAELRSKVRVETYRMDMVLEGASRQARITTDDRSGSFANYYGHDAMDVHRFGQVTYHDVYPGIDWKVYTTAKGIEYDFIVHPSADPGLIRLRFKDQEELALDKAGRLFHGNRLGHFIEAAPVSYQADAEVATRFVLEGDLLRFELSTYDRSLPITIDPARIWATYYGSTGDDAAYSTAVDGSGNVYLAGQTKSSGSIASGGHQNTLGGNYDAYLVKFDASGARLWATYYGGTLEDGGTSCAVDASGNVYLAGYSKSTSGIAASGHQGTLGGGQDAFLVKFNASGVRQWATYYGGVTFEFGACCAVDGNGNAYLAGSSNSSAGIGSGGHQNSYNGNYDAFLVKFDASGVRQWGTYYGGTNGENGNACAVDGSGNVYLAGQTNSSGSIASSGHQSTFGGGTGDGFLVKFNTSGVRQWGTYYGGTGNELGHGCAVDGLGNVYLTGETTSSTGIAAGGFQNSRKGLIDAFLVKFNAAGTRQWGTYYGGTANDLGWSCVTDASANIYLVGQTSSTSRIAKAAHQYTLGGGADAFVVKLDPNGDRLWGSYYGGLTDDSGRSGALDANGNIYIAGYTNSTGAISAGGFQNTFGGIYDGFLAKLSSLSGCPGGNEVVVVINSDGDPEQLTWQVTDVNNVVIASGGPVASEDNQVVTDTLCLGSTPTSACYGFRLMDSFGDGIVGGGWELRTRAGALLLRDDFDGGANSPSTTPLNPNYGSAHSFCLPIGPANIAPTECGLFNNQLGNKVYANKVTGASNYQFEFSDPDAGFMRRIARPYNYVHFWDMVTNPLVPGVKYFARVRTDRDGPMATAHFGTGCEMGLSLPAVVTCTELIQAPAYGHSCNEVRSFNTNNSFIYAKPVVGATEYQFHIFNIAEGYDQTFIRSTYILQLKWNPNVAALLQDGNTYDVEINVKVNGVYSGFCASNCTITIDNSNDRPEASITRSMGTASMWPNPVRDGQVNLNIDGLVDADQQINVDIQDIHGKKVLAQEFRNSGERFNSTLALPSDIACGIYMVSIAVNGERTVQRLSIIK